MFGFCVETPLYKKVFYVSGYISRSIWIYVRMIHYKELNKLYSRSFLLTIQIRDGFLSSSSLIAIHWIEIQIYPEGSLQSSKIFIWKFVTVQKTYRQREPHSLQPSHSCLNSFAVFDLVRVWCSSGLK